MDSLLFHLNLKRPRQTTVVQQLRGGPAGNEREKSEKILVEAERPHGPEEKGVPDPIERMVEIEADQLLGATVVAETRNPIFQSKSGLKNVTL